MWFSKKRPLPPRAPAVVDRSGRPVTRPKTDSAKAVRSTKGIRAYRPNDPERKAEEEFTKKTLAEKHRDAVTTYTEWVRRQNDPKHLTKLAEHEIARVVMEDSMRNAQVLPGKDGHLRLWPKNEIGLQRMLWAMRQLWPKTPEVVTKVRMPQKDPWWTFVKDVRKRTGDE